MTERWQQLPEDLRGVPKWCIAAPDKSPYTTTGSHASVTNPAHWSDFYSASNVAAQWGADIGFVLSDDDEYACIDLDVKDDTPQEELDRYWKIVQAFDSYTEFSRSGRGLHIWVRGKIGAGARRAGVEVYSQQRFIICTGNPLPGYGAKPVERRQELLDMLLSDIRRMQDSRAEELEEVEESESDEVLWQRAADADNGPKFNQLWAGDWKGLHYPSQSEADLSLLSMLCFYSKSNEQVRRMFRMSALGKRDKATKNDKYLDRTLAIIRARQKREDLGNAQAAAVAVQLVQRAEPARLLPIPAESTLEWPPGVLGRLAQWFYSIAPRPVREVSIVSALGIAAGMFGRAYNISGSGLNLYVVLVARSAIGKEAMHSSISKFVHVMLSNGCVPFSNFVDFSDYASGPALVKAITGSESGSFVNVAGEWGRKLRKMGDDHTEGPMSSLRTVMTNLYQKSSAGTIVGGIGYSDKEKNVASSNGIAYSMIGETTPDTFYEALTNTMMQDGFMSRFIVVEYAGLRPEFNTATANPIPNDLVEHFINAGSAVFQCPPGGFKDVAMSREAQHMMDAFNLHCDEQINGTDDESWRQMWNRAHLKALKIGALLAVTDNPMSPIVTEEHADWALAVVNRDIKIMRRKMAGGDVGDGDVARERKLIAVLTDYIANTPSPAHKVPPAMRSAGVVTRSYLSNKVQRTNSFVKHRLGLTKALDDSVRSLCDSGYLMEVPKDRALEEWGFAGKAYRIVSLPDVVS